MAETPEQLQAWLDGIETRNQSMQRHPGFVAMEAIDEVINEQVPRLIALARQSLELQERVKELEAKLKQLEAENARLREDYSHVLIEGWGGQP